MKAETTKEKWTGSIEEAAKVLKTGRNQTYEAEKSGEIPTMRMGKRIIVLWQQF